MEFSAQQIAEILNGTIEGDPKVTVHNISKIECGTPGTLSFLANPKYTHYIYETKASIVLINEDFVPTKPIEACLIRVKNSYEALAKLLEIYNQLNEKPKGIEKHTFIHKSAKIGSGLYLGAFAYIEKGVQIGKNVKIYPHVYIGNNTVIGDNTIIFSGVKIYHNCVIGNHCTIHAGTVIGADGFGFVPQNETEFIKVAQIGNVIIEDNVEIGANCCIDRATIGSTIIRKGVKLDNLIQVAHNVEIGKSTVIAAQTGISGTTQIGNNCMIAGQVGIIGHLKIGDSVMIGAQSGVTKDINNNMQIMGAPATEGHEYKKSLIGLRKLPDLINRLNKVEKELNNLKQNNQE
mgnify:CR=1 FL=1